MANIKRINKPLAIKRFIEDNPLALGFVLEALDRYATAQLTAPDWEGQAIVSQDYWRELARKARDIANAD